MAEEEEGSQNKVESFMLKIFTKKASCFLKVTLISPTVEGVFMTAANLGLCSIFCYGHQKYFYFLHFSFKTIN